MDELIGVLELLRPKLSRKKGLDLGAFLAGLEEIRPQLRASEEELAEFGKSQFTRKQAALAELPWFERPGFDWESYHPDARELLDDPFFWSETNDYAPHGNDTGADLLVDFLAWNQEHPQRAGETFLRQLLAKWGLAERVEQFQAFEPRELDRDDETAFVVVHEATVALAFAEIKARGICSPSVADRAVTHLRQLLDPSFHRALGWPEPSREGQEAYERLVETLQKYLPETSSRIEFPGREVPSRTAVSCASGEGDTLRQWTLTLLKKLRLWWK